MDDSNQLSAAGSQEGAREAELQAAPAARGTVRRRTVAAGGYVVINPPPDATNYDLGGRRRRAPTVRNVRAASLANLQRGRPANQAHSSNPRSQPTAAGRERNKERLQRYHDEW